MFRFPKLPLQLPRIISLVGSTRRLIMLIPVVLILVFGVGGNFVYRKPDSIAAQRFTRLLPFPAALVGPQVIWVSQIFSQERFTKMYGTKTNQVIPESAKIRSEVLDHLVEVKLVSAEAGRHNVGVTSREIDDQFETIASQNGGREQILTTLKELYGMDEPSFKRLIAEQLLIDKFKREVLVSASVRHILVKDQNKATELAQKAKEGGDFAQLAKENSEDTGSRDSGGSLGFIGRGTTAKPFEDVAFSLPVGQISDPVQTEFGWHIILVEEKKGIVDKSYADWLAEAKNNTRIVKFLNR